MGGLQSLMTLTAFVYWYGRTCFNSQAEKQHAKCLLDCLPKFESWWWTGRPGLLWFMRSRRVGHNWAAELNWTEETCKFSVIFIITCTTVYLLCAYSHVWVFGLIPIFITLICITLSFSLSVCFNLSFPLFHCSLLHRLFLTAVSLSTCRLSQYHA